jgi:hypothetical protein
MKKPGTRLNGEAATLKQNIRMRPTMQYVNRSLKNTSGIIKQPEIPKKKEIPTAIENSVENRGQNKAPNATEAKNVSEFNRNGELTDYSIN